jgi:acyl-CoA reductase-like NAD-dependent aldehyde dehydrogenase
MENLIHQSSYINGRFCDVHKLQTWEVKDKYTGELIENVGLANADEVEEAIQSNQKAFKDYAKYSAGKKRDLILALKVELEKQSEPLARLIVREAGKPLFYARVEVERAIDTLEFAAEEARRLGGERVPMDFNNGESRTAMTQLFPKGPVLGISPFNFPLNLALHKIAPALASGCSISVKPSPFAPLTLLALAKMMDLAGFPPGLVNIVVCPNELTEKMVEDERFKLFSFTGSPQVGWMLKAKVKNIQAHLELGGNAPVIIDRNCDLDVVAKKVAMGSYLYSGQICISTQRILVDRKVSADFETKLVEEIEKLKVGNPQQEDVIVGPMISYEHLERVNQWVGEAVAGGAVLLTGGKVLSKEHNLFAPTLLKNVDSKAKVCREEVFGPVAILESFESFEQGLESANNSQFGLQAGVFTDSVENMKKAFTFLEVGAVIINDIPGFRIDHMPYGGVKNSGLGREGLRYTIEAMTEPRLLVF